MFIEHNMSDTESVTGDEEELKVPLINLALDGEKPLGLK
jgi:hypothetical protein